MAVIPCNPPESLTLTLISSTSIQLDWIDGDPYDVQIQRKVQGGTYSYVDTVAAAQQTYTDTGVSPATTYYYRIRHYDGSYGSDWVESSAIQTSPAAPTDLAASYAGVVATLTWTNHGTYTYVKVYYKLSSEPTTWTTATETLAGTSETYDVTVSTENTDYDFRVRGWSSSNGDSEYVTITEQESGIKPPTDLEGVADDLTVTLTWTDNSSVETGYEIWVDGVLAGTVGAGVETEDVVCDQISTEYLFKVRAYDATKFSPFSTEIPVTTGAAPDAAPVIGSVTVNSSTSLTVTWTDTATNADGIYVYRSTDDILYDYIDDVAIGVQTYTDTTLVDDTTYYYKVRAYNGSGMSAFSASANGQTSLDLDPPTGLIATAVSDAQIKIEWTDNAPSADYHEVYRKTTGSYTYVADVISGTSEYTDGSLSASTAYTYRVRARHDTPTTYGDWSAPITKDTLAGGTTSTRKNQTYIGLSNVLAIVTDTPTNEMTCFWRSKPMDFADEDEQAYNRFKVVKCIRIEFVDEYASVPVTVYVSVDDGEHWNSCSRYIGEGDGTSKYADFYIEPLTGKYFTIKVSSTSAITSFSWTGIDIEYQILGEHYENDLMQVDDHDDWVVYERGVVDGGGADSEYLDEETYTGGDA